jgi:hypothetical protein
MRIENHSVLDHPWVPFVLVATMLFVGAVIPLYLVP